MMNVPIKARDPIVHQVYDPSANQWVGISEADGIAEGLLSPWLAAF